MEQTIFEKIETIFHYSTSSFLMLEVLLIFGILFLFLLLNLKYKKKAVSYFISALLLYFLISSLILFGNDFFVAARELLKKCVEYFYFSPIPVYFLTVFLSAICFVRTIFKEKYSKKRKILSYLLLLPIFFFFVTFIIVASTNQIEISRLTEVYKNEVALSLIQVSQVFFFLYLGLSLAFYLYHFVNIKLSNR